MIKKITSALFVLLFFIGTTSFNTDNGFTGDFLQFWNDVNENYAYFSNKHTDWNKVKEVYLPQAEKVTTRDEMVTLLENAIEELYDHHFSLNTNLQTSTRLVPTGLDIWAEWIDGKAIITEIRKGFAADKAGIKTGMEIVSINDVSVEQAVKNRVGKCISPIDTEVKNYALQELLAGTYTKPRVINVKENGKATTFDIDAQGNSTDRLKYNSSLEQRTLESNIGYIKFNNSLDETGVIPLFDDALNQLKNTKALIIDLRETPSGGNAIVARGILSRFVNNDMPFQKTCIAS